ncbi:hypothetical protein ABMA27_003381 [Loxostege sticticalis]|uniref:PiggyBac transposable element-derived protein domain-containing protein n=1 Tax=Loxostege sticticalis TaxID=481309 RepID=A0ABR3HSX4_LOXSC
MSKKKKLSDSVIASILEDDLSAIESSDESDSEEPLLEDCVLDYDDEVSRGLSRIFGEDPELETRGLENFHDPPGPRVSVEYIEGEEPVTEEPVREVSKQNEYDFGALPGPSHPIPAQPDLAQPDEAASLSVPSHPVPAQPDLAQPDEAASTNIASRPIRVAKNWSNEVPKHSIPKFDKRLTLKMRVTHKTPPIEFFDHFFPHDLVDLMVEQTNIYAAQKQTLHWNPTFVAEMRACLGILIMMGLHPLPDVNLYWSTDSFYRNPDIAHTFTQKRFKKLTENIHLNDNSKEPERDTPSHDKLYKIRPMITKLNEVFQTNCAQSSTPSVDESMVKFKGRSTLKQYMPKKPIKRGYKVWARCDAKSGYFYVFDIYIGKADKNASSEEGLGYNVIMKLCQGVPRNTLVAFDNFFTGIPLMNDLLIKKGIYAVGTVRLNRKGLPEELLPKNKLKKEKLGKLEFTYKSKAPVSAIQWLDTQLVNVLTTAHNPKSVCTVERKQKDGSKKAITIPTAIAEYTVNMGGVDHFDHFRASYPIGRKSRRNWLRLFYFMFDSAVINAYIAYIQIHKQKDHTHRDFRLRLARSLIDGFTCKKRTTNITFRNKKGGNFGVPAEIRRSSVPHYPEDQGKFTRCRFCSTKNTQKRSRIICDVCKVALCPTPCFKSFHIAQEEGEAIDCNSSASSMLTG